MSPQLRTTLVYVAVAVTWVWFSDQVVEAVAHDARQMTTIQMFKGWAFVLITGALLYWMIGRTVRRLDQANHALLNGHEQALRVLVEAMDARHKETSDHSERVMRMALGLASYAGLHGDALRKVKFGSLLHDIGKLSLPDAILIKPGKLDDAEMAQMRTHTLTGRDIMERVDFLRDATDIPYSHHERWDGLGYPQGLHGEQIPIAARVFSIVDVWDALSFARVYKPAWPEADVLGYLREVSGKQLDPNLVSLFLDHYDALKAIALDTETSPPVLNTVI